MAHNKAEPNQPEVPSRENHDATLGRREFLGGVAGAAGAAVFVSGSWRPAYAATPLLGTDYFEDRGFTRPLPRPRRIDATGGSSLQVEVVQFEQRVLTGYPKTSLYGYRFGSSPSWPGATVVVKKDHPVEVHWRNRLPLGLNLDSHLLPVDRTVHIANVDESVHLGSLPVVTHLHGGHTESGSDGGPEAWFTQNQGQTGPEFQALYRYDNDQESGTLWYHDHVLGMTRLNVYAGLVGLFLLRDDNELGLIEDGVLPGGPYEVELIIQDRSFSDDGSLFLPTGDIPEPGSIVPSNFLDFMCVNGMPWPYLEVEPRKYRFRLLNACDSRMLILTFGKDGPPLLRVGTDLGFSNKVLELGQLLNAPSERYDFVVDFSDYAGESVVLKNVGVDAPLRGFTNSAGEITNHPLQTPYTFAPGVTGPNPDWRTSEVMEFRVKRPLSSIPLATVAAGDRLRPGGTSLPKLKPTYTRKVVLLTGNDEYGRLMEMQGTLEKGTFAFYEPVTENPELGAVEIWEIYNFTVPPLGLAHPIHIHLVNFQVINREPFTVEGEEPDFGVVPKDIPAHGGHGIAVEGGGRYLDPALVKLSGKARAPEPYEQGPKDVVIAYGGEVTRVIAKFDRPALYVWHCHILHHEDHDMMRPFYVGDLPEV